MRVITRTLAATAGLALALSLTACGSSPSPTPGAGASTSAAAQTTAPADPAPAAEPGAGALTAETLIDTMVETMSSATGYRYGSTAVTAEGTVTYDGVVQIDDGVLSMSIHTEAPGTTMDVVVIDRTIYMNLGEASEGKFVVADLDRALAEIPGFPDFGAIMDVRKSFEHLDGSILDVQQIGPEDVDGEPATRYAVTIDTAKQVEAIATTMGGSVAELIETMSLPPALTSDYWIDARNRPLKQVGTIAGTTTTSTWSDWDSPSIVVEAPPADQISDIDPFGPSDQ